jgi:hypothetical protein
MKCDRQAGLAVLQEVVKSLIRVGSGAETAELAHRPEPASIHRGIDAACVGRLAGITKVLGVVEVPNVIRRVQTLYRNAGNGREQSIADVFRHRNAPKTIIRIVL